MSVENGQHLPNGSFAPGNRVGAMGKNIPKNYKLFQDKPILVTRDLTRVLNEKLREEGPVIFETLVKEAKQGNLQAIALLMKYMPHEQETFVRGGEQVATLSPDERLSLLTQAATAGLLPLEHAKQLAELTKTEIEYAFLRPIKTALLAVKNGASVEKALESLAETIHLVEGVEAA